LRIGVHHVQLRPCETVVQGAEPGRVLCAQAHAQVGNRAVIRRNLGSKLLQMEFTTAS
jgi:pyruvate,water dikinase